uniref:TTI1 N-terminal TPR domain-containing protein n=1 Tax=Clytia hemisphaerica TaxID=252671 RepID=A0A7M5X2G5_9CNID
MDAEYILNLLHTKTNVGWHNDATVENILASKSLVKSEEHIIAALEMIKQLLNKTNLEVLQTIYNKEDNLPLLGHVLSIILKFLEKQRNKELLVTALDAIQLLSGGKFTTSSLANTVASYILHLKY